MAIKGKYLINECGLELNEAYIRLGGFTVEDNRIVSNYYIYANQEQRMNGKLWIKHFQQIYPNPKQLINKNENIYSLLYGELKKTEELKDFSDV